MEDREDGIEWGLDGREYDLKDRVDQVFDWSNDWRHFGTEVTLLGFVENDRYWIVKICSIIQYMYAMAVVCEIKT